MAEQSTQYLDMPVPVGMDTATAPELVAPNRALSIRNCHVGTGVPTERRPFTRVTRQAYIDNLGVTQERRHGEIKAVLPFGKTPLIATEESRLYAKADFPSAAPWTEVERNDSPVSFKQALHSGPVELGEEAPYRYRNPNLAITGDYACITWWRRKPVVGEGSPALTGYAMIYDLAREFIVRIDKIAENVGIGTPSSDGSNPSLVPVAASGVFFIFWIDTSTNELKYTSKLLSVMASEWATAGALVSVSALGTLGSFDAVSDGQVVYVAYNDTDLKVSRCTISVATLSISHTTTSTGTGVAPTIALGVNADRVMVAHTNASGHVYGWALNPADVSEATNGARTQISSASTTAFKQLSCNVYEIEDKDGGSEIKSTVVWTNSTGTERFEFATYIASVPIEHLTSTDLDAFEVVRGVNQCHRPFRLSGLATNTLFAPSFVGLRRNQDNEDAYYTYIASLDSSTNHLTSTIASAVVTPVARYSGLTASYLRGTDDGQAVEEQGVCKVFEYGGRHYWAGVEQVPTYDGDTRDTLHIYSLDFSRDRCWNAVTHNGVTLVAGSIPRMISPEVLSATAEAERRGLEGTVPLHSPPPAELLATVSGGSLTATAQYFYCQTYEYVDVTGRVHRSLPSAPQSLTLIGSQDTIALGLYAEQSPQPGYQHHTVVFWRSLGNPADTNAITFYRLAEVNAYNPENSLIDVYVDGASDASISDNEILYTVSGELPNYPPPPSAALCLWKNRIVALDSETGKLWPSKVILDREWPGFHEGLAIGTDVHTSKPVFLSEDTDNLIVWWKDAIGVVYGEPGSDTGALGSLAQPRLLGQRGIGLQYVKSLVRTQIGHIFKSAKGFYLLDPSMSLTYIGQEVEAYNDAVVVGADVVTTPNGSQEVRFETQSIDTVSGLYVTLVYDLARQGWHFHTRGRRPLASAVVEGLSYVATAASVADTPWNSTGLQDLSGLWVESQDTEVSLTPAEDPSGEYTALIDTPWYTLAGKAGSSRVRRIWMLCSNTSVFGERSLSIVVRRDYRPVDVQTVSATQGVTSSFVELPIGGQECASMRFRISGFQRLVSLRLEVEAERGSFRRNNVIAG